MNKISAHNRLTLFLIGLLILAVSEDSLALDSGNIYRLEPDKHRVHLAVIVDPEVRPLDVNSSSVLNAIATFFPNDEDIFSAKMTGKTKTNSIFFRPTLFLGDQLSLFLDAGLYNDVDAIISPPFFIGGGGRVTQEVFTDVNLSIYGKAHITGKYEFPLNFDMGEDYGGYQSNMNGRLLMGTIGGIITTRLPLESMEILPYLGAELSAIRGKATITKLLIPPDVSILNRVERNQRNVTLSQNDMPFLILGVTILRPNMATLRFESKISQSSTTLSLGIGVFF